MAEPLERPEPSAFATGWDVGGAHLKVAQADTAGGLLLAVQVPCRLWLGLGELEAALAAVRPRLAPSSRHGVTMTGELADLFPDRSEGVRHLAAAMRAALPDADLRLYAGRRGFVRLGHEVGQLADERSADWPGGDRDDGGRLTDSVPPAHDVGHLADAASANWHASARWLAGRLPAGLLADVGSTTTDLVPFAAGAVRAQGYRDHERMIAGELVYTGVTRTPVMAMAASVAFDGVEHHPLMAELFATTTDVHRLTGALPPDADQHATADGRGTGLAESAARLARMLGRDAGDVPLANWRTLAGQLADRQAQVIVAAARRVANAAGLDGAAPVVGAGIGRFLARELAERLGRPYIDLATLLAGDPAATEWGARCAPAAAIALLIAETRSA